MRCFAVPKGYELVGERNPWKRLFRWAWRCSAALSVISAGVAASFLIRTELGECTSGNVRYRCGIDKSAAEASAALWGIVAGGLLFWSLCFACCCWLVREYRTCIQPTQ